MNENKNEYQQEFDKLYIGPGEIMERLDVDRVAMLYRRRAGYLPGEITLNGTAYFWKREFIEPFLVAWEDFLDAKRRVKELAQEK